MEIPIKRPLEIVEIQVQLYRAPCLSSLYKLQSDADPAGALVFLPILTVLPEHFSVGSCDFCSVSFSLSQAIGNRVTVGGGCHLLGTIAPCVCTSRKEELALRVVGHFSAALESPACVSVHVPKGLRYS